MFGKKKNKLKSQFQDFFIQITEQRKAVESKIESIEERQVHMDEDITQAQESAETITNYIEKNMLEVSSLLQQMDEFTEGANQYHQQFQQILEQTSQYRASIFDLVDENKHYTTPSKLLKELPVQMHHQNQACEQKLSAIADANMAMQKKADGILVEAKKLGKSGALLLTDAEALKQVTVDQAEEVMSMRQDILSAQAKIEELEEVIQRLITLIKDGNISATKLLKNTQGMDHLLNTSCKYDLANEAMKMRDEVVMIRNLEEEISKSNERNRMLFEDVKEELRIQKKEIRECESDLSYLFDISEEKLK